MFKEKMNLYILSIVGIVAIVGIVVLILNSSGSRTLSFSTDDAVGYAFMGKVNRTNGTITKWSCGDGNCTTPETALVCPTDCMDSDGDGYTDTKETSAGTDPNDISSMPCEDSDSGKDYENAGKATGTFWSANSGSYLSTAEVSGVEDLDDYCSSDGDHLGERYCENNIIELEWISCSDEFGENYVCQDGACVEESVSEIVIVGSHDGYVYVLNAEDGSLVEKLDVTDASEYHGEVTSEVLYLTEAVSLWAYDINDFSSLGSDTSGTYVYDSGGLSYFEADQPTAKDYYIYVGSTSDRVIAIDLNNAEIYWQYDVSLDENFNKPAILGYTIYAAGKSGTIYALDMTNIIDGGDILRSDDDYPDTLWTYDVDAADTSDLLVGPVAGDAIYVGDDAGYVYALDTDSTVLWSTRVAKARVYGLTIYNDVLYVSASNSVFAVDTDTGTVSWEYETGDLVQSEALEASVTSYVYFGSDDGYIYAVDADDGSEVWTYNAGEDVNGDPYVVKSVGSLGSVLYIGGESGTVFALDADDGTELWTYSTGSYVRGRPTYYLYN